MFVSIRTKLFILIVVAITLMMAALMALNAVSFSRSFSDYVARQEARRLEPLVQNIALTYAQKGDWRWLRWDDADWMNVVRRSFGPRDLRNLDRPMPMMPSNNGLRGYLDHLVIRDAQNERIVFGQKKGRRDLIWLPIRVKDGGDTVAFLGYEPSARLESQFDRVFAQQQRKQFWLIGLFGFLVAAGLAIPFSGWLVKPIQTMTLAMRQMTQGDLTVTVNEDRNDELGELARDFNQLAQALAKNHQARQQWVSDIAHELRTPIAIFQADIEAAQDGVRTVDAQWLSTMHTHVERLTRLVNDLHQLSQSDAGTLSYRFETLNLVDVVEAAVTQFRQTCQDCFIDPHWQPPEQIIPVRADDARLNQLFSNLAQNTLRYTDGSFENHGQLIVSIETMESQVNIIWQDSSPGVGDADLDHLFDRLYRVDESRSRENGGSGLGLAIVKNIVQAHQGTIRAQHSEVGGLKIIVTLPTLHEGHRL